MRELGLRAQNRRIFASLKISYPPNISSAPSPVNTTLKPLLWTAPDNRNIGAGAVRRTGCSVYQITSGNTLAISSLEQLKLLWRVCKNSLAWPWYVLSSNSTSSKLMENVLRRSPTKRWASAVMKVESMPPLRYAPTGTSDLNRIRVASISRSRSCAANLSESSSSPSSGSYSSCQYSRTLMPFSSTTIECPGGSCQMPRKAVLGGSVTQNVKIWSKACRSSSACTSRQAINALISEAKRKQSGV